LVAFAPIFAAAFLLVGLRRPAKRTMPLIYVIAALIAGIIWQVSIPRIIASSIQGLFITFDILYISLRRSR
jgi:lactate permease